MSGFLIQWLSHYARPGLLTLAVLVFGFTAVFSQPSLCASVARAVTSPTAPAMQPGTTEWPRTVLRLWFFLPQFLPHDS
jgi:hypothetical protein